MLSAHYTGHSTPLHAHSAPIVPQTQYTHHHHHPLLPTPPSSPPTIGMRPVESTISLLDSLVAFYHQERMWVYRTRAQLEMGLFNRGPNSKSDTSPELDDDPASPGQLQTQSTDSANSPESSSPSPPTKWLKRKKAFNLRLEGISATRSGGVSKHPHPHTQRRARQSSNLNPASAPAQSAMHPTSAALHPYPPVPMASSNATASFYPPTAINTATTLTSPYLSHPSLQYPSTASQQPLTPGVSARYVPAPHSTVQPSQSLPAHAGPLVLGAGGREPTVQILEMFERMMQARMESCERVTRMVREANKPGGVVGETNLGSVGGPVGGFGGPVGLPVGIGPQGIVGAYPPTAEGQDPQTQTQTQQGFPMGVNMA